MLPVASQTAGPIGLTFFVDSHGWPGGAIGLKIRNFIYYFCSFFQIFFPQATPGPSDSYYYY